MRCIELYRRSVVVCNWICRGVCVPGMSLERADVIVAE